MIKTQKDIIQRSGIIEAEALSQWLESDSPPVILDATFTLPNDPYDAKAAYETEHISGALWFDIKGDFADLTASTGNMLCTADQFAFSMGKLGIRKGDFVIVYGQSGMVMGPARAWWSLKAYGHDNVAVLNGGLPAWRDLGYATTNTIKHPPSSEYPIPDHRLFYTEAAEILKHNGPILDARPAPRFFGTSPEPRSDMRSGHIPKSKNLPASSLIDPVTGKLKSPEALTEQFIESGYATDCYGILTCGSGVTACVLALALHHLGIKEWSVYDGSWAEWGQVNNNYPIKI